MPKESCSVVGSIPYWDQRDAIKSFKENLDVIDHISLFWYTLGPEGEIQKYRYAHEDRDLIELAQDRGVKVLALVANLPDDEREGGDVDWSPERVGRVIDSESSRAAHVADLLELARRLELDGLVIDYEALPGAYRTKFTLFIEALGAALHAEDKILAVAIHPKTSENNPEEDNGSWAQDWEALSEHADQLHFMTYSQHTAGSEPGPVASAHWAQRVLEYGLSERSVPRAKLYFGLPLYAQEWEEAACGGFRGIEEDMTYQEARERMREHGAEPSWSCEHHSPFVRFRDSDGAGRIIWFENERSIRAKLAVAAELGVCNLLLWRLGGEPPSLWELLRGGGESEDDAEDEEGEGLRSDPAHLPSIPNQKDDAAVEENTSEPPQGEEVYPRLEGELGTDLEYYVMFATRDPEDERYQVVSHLHMEQGLELSPNLSLLSDVRAVLESDGEDGRFYSDFPHRGIYLRELWLKYESDHYSVFGGKYEPAGRLRGYGPIYFGNFTTELELGGRIGGGASITGEHEALGRHTLTGHLFHKDTTRLRGEIFSDRWREDPPDGEVGEMGLPDSYLMTISGGTFETDATFTYTLGAGEQRRPRLLDEQIYLGALLGTIPAGAGDLEISADAMSLENSGGLAQDSRSLGFGFGYSDWPTYLGGGYSFRQVEFKDEGSRRDDHIMEVVARQGFGPLIVEAAYQHSRAWGTVENAIGIELQYWIHWDLKKGG